VCWTHGAASFYEISFTDEIMNFSFSIRIFFLFQGAAAPWTPAFDLQTPRKKIKKMFLLGTEPKFFEKNNLLADALADSAITLLKRDLNIAMLTQPM